MSSIKPFLCAFVFLTLWFGSSVAQQSNSDKNANDRLTDEQIKSVRAVEKARIKVVNKVIGSVLAIYGDDRQGGGSGVVIDSTGIGLTNHHVIAGAGVSGWAGMADGNLYRWHLIGTDPGGDVALIQLEGKDNFPFTPLGNSDDVHVGDWALAMGNPFVLTEDEVPTVTLGIVSGVKRFQPGAGQNQLVYGNCIQIDSSINPGNSGGPLFSMKGEVIGINGRGSFEARGRVNVGLGYAISSNQIKNFIPDLLATKLVEHGTLDASFGVREGRVVCDTLVEESVINRRGLELGDELLEFENTPIKTVNQYLNLICTLPEDWPAKLLIKKKDGTTKTMHVRMYGLPYARPPNPKSRRPGGKKPTPRQKRQLEKMKAMFELLAAEPGTIRDKKMNATYVSRIVNNWRKTNRIDSANSTPKLIHMADTIFANGNAVGSQEAWICTDGRMKIKWDDGETNEVYTYDGNDYWKSTGEDVKKMTVIEAKLTPAITQAMCIIAPYQNDPFSQFGKLSLDGGDKSMNRVSYRMKSLDQDEDWFYFWLSMEDSNGNRDVRVLKASSEKDGDQNARAFLFDDWQDHDGIQLPHSRSVVDGLAEAVRYELKAKKISVTTDVDSTLFKVEEASQ